MSCFKSICGAFIAFALGSFHSDAVAYDLAEPLQSRETVLILTADDFVSFREEAVVTGETVDGHYFELGIRIEDHETMVSKNRTLEVNLASPLRSQVRTEVDLEEQSGSPMDLIWEATQSVCGDVAVRSFYETTERIDVIVDFFDEPSEVTQFSGSLGDVLVTPFSKCDRFVGYDGECGGTCGVHYLDMEDLWGWYRYGSCIPAGDYWLSSCKCDRSTLGSPTRK